MRCSLNWSSKETLVSWNYSISRSWKGISAWIWKTVSVRLGIVGPCWINEGIRFHSRGDVSFFTYFPCTLAGLDTLFLVFFLSPKKTKNNLDHEVPDSHRVGYNWVTELNWTEEVVQFCFLKGYILCIEFRLQMFRKRTPVLIHTQEFCGFFCFFFPSICLLYFFNHWKTSDKMEFNLLIPEI